MLMGGYEVVVAAQFIGMLTNVLAQHKNAERVSATQEKLADRQQANFVLQQRQQWRMQQEGYKHQIASQMRAYDLQNSWPLDTTPATIADMIENCKGNMPLLLIFAPEEKSGIQKELYSVWTDLRNYFLTSFRVSSDTPVIESGYRDNYPIEPTQDFMKIYNGLKGIPTLYMASYKTRRERVLGITIAFWGRGEERPMAQNVEIDLRKLYVDTIRDEVLEYKRLCDLGTLAYDEKCSLAKNHEVFSKENRNVDFEYRDQSLQMYSTLKPTPRTFEVMSAKVSPILQLFSVGIVDAYFVLGYGTSPKFPELVNNLNPENLPELYLRNSNGKQDVINGKDFIKRLKDGYYNGVIGLSNAVASIGTDTILIPVHSGETVECSLVGFCTGKTVCVEDGGNGPLIANRPAYAGVWERFSLVRNADGSFSLKSAANGKYVSAVPNLDGCLYAEGPKVDLWEKFDLREVEGKSGCYTLWSHVTKKYVSVDENNDNVLIANRDRPDCWEWFCFRPMSAGSITNFV